MKQEYKVGDWVIHDYKIHQVTAAENGKVQELSTGFIRCSGNDLEVRPLTLKNKVYAERFESYYRDLGDVTGANALNWPDINRYFAELCFKAIDDKTNYKDGEVNKFLLEGQDFVRKTIDALRGVDSVNGVRLFRR